MAGWLVELQGDPAELGELADQLRSSRLNVREEEERYYLRAPEEFDGLSDVDEVRARATELLFLLSGIANLYAGTGETVTPGNVIIWERDDGTRDQFIQMEAMTMRVRATALLWGTKAIDPTIGESWLTLARRDEKVMDALQSFQEDTTWWSLRKTYEVLEKDEFKKQESKLAQKLSISEHEIKRFKKWVHFYYTAGEESAPIRLSILPYQ